MTDPIETKRVPTEQASTPPGLSPGPRVHYSDPYYGEPPGGAPEVGLLGKVTLDRLIRVATRKWLTIGLVTLGAIVISTVYLMFAERVYRADALIEMSMRRPRIMGAQGAIIDDGTTTWGSEEIFNTRLEKLRSDDTRKIAAGKLKDILGNQQSMEEVERLLPPAQQIDFRLVPRTRLTRITVDYHDAALAAALANAFAQTAETIAFEENRTTSESAVAWLQVQVQVQRKALEKAEEALVAFRAENQLDSLEARKKNIQDALEEFNVTLVKLESQSLLAREMVGILQSIDREPGSAGRIPLTIPRQEEISGMLGKWTEAVAQRESMLTRLTPRHPDVLAQDETIQNLRRQLQDAVQRARDTVQSDLSLVEKQVNSLKAESAIRRKELAELDLVLVRGKSTQSSLERERDASDLSYRGVLNRIEEARLSADENTATVKLVKPATPPAHPVKPRVPRIMLLALILGGVGGLVLAMFTDALEDYITSTADFEGELGLKILGLIPHMDVQSREELALASLNDKFSQVAEAFAGVRSLIDSLAGPTLSRSVLMISTTAGEGKTITACNLAIMTAKRGLKTLLVDFDLRRPRVGRMFKVDAKSESLIHALSEKNPGAFDRLPQKTGCENLEIITTRATQELSAAEILGSRRVQEFMKWAEARYDRVIVDSPPYGMVSDVVSLAALTGCLVLVCRPNKSRKRATQHAITRLAEAGAHVLGVVVNDVDFSKGSLMSNYRYSDTHYNYRDRYGADEGSD